MKLLEDVFVEESIEIRTTAEKIFAFLFNLVDVASYRAWHPEDHVTIRWIKGAPWQEGSVVYAEEYIHGKLHKVTFIITKVVPNRRVEFAPVSRLLRRYFPRNTFEVESKEDGCVFTATAHVRLGPLFRWLAKKSIARGLASAKQHMKEEGENLKKILEAKETSPEKYGERQKESRMPG